MADIVRCAGQAFIEHSRTWINWQHQKVLLAVTRCRTAALGGHRDRCTGCGDTTAISYNSCRNRHCPRCQGNARRRWLKARERELLPTPYVHAVFTLPRELAPLTLQNKKLIYNLLFHASAETLLEVARDPRHLGAEIGFFSVLHSWNQRLQFHPHIHCVVAAGGLAPDHSSWVSARHSFFLPIGVLSRIFRGKFVAGLRDAFHRGELQFHGSLAPLSQPRAFAAWLRVLFRHHWGRLLQEALRWTGTCVALSRRIHASRRHLQRKAGCSLRWQRHPSLARFRTWQQKAAHDSGRR
jgi:Transposase zinc-binding domain/Putative transposase